VEQRIIVAAQVELPVEVRVEFVEAEEVVEVVK